MFEVWKKLVLGVSSVSRMTDFSMHIYNQNILFRCLGRGRGSVRKPPCIRNPCNPMNLILRELPFCAQLPDRLHFPVLVLTMIDTLMINLCHLDDDRHLDDHTFATLMINIQHFHLQPISVLAILTLNRVVVILDMERCLGLNCWFFSI